MGKSKMYVRNGILNGSYGQNGVVGLTKNKIIRVLPIHKDKRLWSIVKRKNLVV